MKNPIVKINVRDRGTMTLELFPEVAPNTVNNFISLVKKGFYDGLCFHRIIPQFMIQGGDPEGRGTGGPGYCIYGEFSSNGFKNDLKHTYGVISMARSMKADSAGSQFFIMVSDSPHLDGNYASFGKLIDGKDVLNSIAHTSTFWNDSPEIPQIIDTITVDTFGVDYPEPEHAPDPEDLVE